MLLSSPVVVTGRPRRASSTFLGYAPLWQFPWTNENNLSPLARSLSHQATKGQFFPWVSLTHGRDADSGPSLDQNKVKVRMIVRWRWQVCSISCRVHFRTPTFVVFFDRTPLSLLLFRSSWSCGQGYSRNAGEINKYTSEGSGRVAITEKRE